ncbi:MAG: protein-methionine-sulfoxide reductase heme-binding subunit MsrQ [Dehalococcoidales bacterium]|nr:protein-methionine-sulfoxide reductase heme-binding subunit MsrQ [Dehalococcoidales bacterium]
MPKLKVPSLQILVHIGALLPLAWLAWQFSQDQLTANPIREIQLRTGRYALNLLALSLACTPVYNIFGFKPALQLRRTLGLYAFLYAGLHLLNFIGLDYGFNFTLIEEGIAAKPFALVGLAAFLILLPLAVTSTKGWVKRLGNNWPRLHRLLYVAAVLAVLHFIWLTKSKADIRVPLVYGAVIALLLILRIPVIRRLISHS